MKKIAENYYRVDESVSMPNFDAALTVDVIDGEELDTDVSINLPLFCVAGGSRKEFLNKLDSLISEYRI